MEGSCLCGAVKVKVTDDEVLTKGQTLLCHCENCRKCSGGLFAANLIADNSNVFITGEENLKVYSDGNTTSGTPVLRYFCSTCGAPIKSTTSHFEGKSILKLGIYPKLPPPGYEVFVGNKQDWEKPFEGCTLYKKGFGGEKMEIS